MNRTNPRNSVCPACHGERTSALFSISSSEAAQFLVIREGVYRERHDALVAIIERMWQERTCEMRQCGECGFGFAAPFVAGDAEFYNLAFPTVAYPSSKWEYARTLRALRTTRTEGRHGLEIAAGNGYFLDLCIAQGLFEHAQLTATEFNQASLASLRDKGYNASSEDFRNPGFSKLAGPFDFVFMFQVVEHLDDVDGLFGRLKDSTAPDAKIFIAVPNNAWIRYREQHESLPDLPPVHIGRWTPDAFRAAASRHGLVVTDFQVEPFAPVPFIRDDLIFSHFARAHRIGTLANRARSLGSRTARRIAEAFETLMFAPARIPAMIAGFEDRKSMGGAALWVQIESRG